MHGSVEIGTKPRKIDIRGGKLTYGQRIELGQILTDPKRSEAEKYAAAMEALHPGWKRVYTPAWVAWFAEVIEGIAYWAEREAAMLSYRPTAEESAAGCEELGRRLGPMATVTALAEKYGRDPDEILQWEYGKVFGLLYADLERAKYQQRYRKVVENRERMRRLAHR